MLRLRRSAEGRTVSNRKAHLHISSDSFLFSLPNPSKRAEHDVWYGWTHVCNISSRASSPDAQVELASTVGSNSQGCKQFNPISMTEQGSALKLWMCTGRGAVSILRKQSAANQPNLFEEKKVFGVEKLRMGLVPLTAPVELALKKIHAS